jgi:phosphoserine phosphatase RsbU/P
MRHELRCQPRVAAIADHVDDVMEKVGPAFDAPAARVALTEAMLNAVVHGALGVPRPIGSRDPVLFADRIAEAERHCPADRGVAIEVETARDRPPLVRVRDPGRGFDWRGSLAASEQVPSPHAAGGRGLFLVRHGVAKVTWNERGNEIALELRAKGASTEAARIEEPPASIPHPASERRRPPRILLVDDDPVGRRLAQAILRAKGYLVTEAADAFEAQVSVASAPPDAIVLDLEMPGMSGVALLVKLRESGLLARCPVLMLTATKPPPELCVGALEAGAWHFLAKPIAGRELVARLASVLATQQRIDALGAERDQLVAADDDVASLVGALSPAREVHRFGHVLVSHVVAANSVGGDLVDLVDIDDQRFAAVLVDVAGHGRKAAMTAGAMRCLARDKLASNGDLVATVTSLNQRAYADFGATRQHVAISALLVDEAAGTLTVINAGNPPIVVVRRDGSVEQVRSSAPSLGLAPTFEGRAQTFDLRLIARVVALTDGLVERVAGPGDSVGALETLAGAPLHPRLPPPVVTPPADGAPARDDASFLFLCIDEEKAP